MDAADPVILPTDSLVCVLCDFSCPLTCLELMSLLCLFQETLFPWTMQPIPEEEHAEAMLGFDAPVYVHAAARVHVEPAR